MFAYVARQYRWYKLEFGLTMLSWWEVAIFSTSPFLSSMCVAGLLSACRPLTLTIDARGLLALVQTALRWWFRASRATTSTALGSRSSASCSKEIDHPSDDRSPHSTLSNAPFYDARAAFPS